MSQLVLKHPDLKHEDLKFNTVEVHAGEPRDMYGALIPPIYQTSTFYFDSTDDAVKACDDYAESFAYSRITNPSVDYLEQKLAALEHGKGAVAYASGMGAISGSAFTGIAALGSIMIPELQKEGYSRGFATSLVTCSSILGTLIPPSIPIIVLGWTTGISILGCFMATVVPGIITILTFSAINVFYARRYAKKENAEAIEGQVTKAKPKASRAFVEAIPALLLPVIILGGIYGGFFTATEAAGVCSVLALLLGALVYRQLKVKNTMDMLKTTASSIGSIFMMIFFCLLLSQCMTQLKIPQMLVDIFLGFTNNKFVVLIMVNVFLLFVGMIVNDTTAIMLCAPLLMPLLTAYGVNPIHFGALMIVNLSCGCLTPPYASVLYFGMKVGNAKFGEMMKNTLVFLLVGYVPVMLLTTYVEAISLFLPRLLGYA